MATVIRYDTLYNAGVIISPPAYQEWLSLIRWPNVCRARIIAKNNIFDGIEARW